MTRSEKFNGFKWYSTVLSLPWLPRGVVLLCRGITVDLHPDGGMSFHFSDGLGWHDTDVLSLNDAIDRGLAMPIRIQPCDLEGNDSP